MRRLAIDFGTSNTVAAVAVDGQSPRTITFGPSSLMPSAVYAGPDGITVGREAQRQARLDPSRFEPNPKRRIDDGEVLLGDQVFPVVELIAAVLRSVLAEVRRQLDGQALDEVRLTHPAQWGGTRRNTLLTAARLAGLGGQVELVPEPVAAAAQFTQLPGRGLADGRAVAIYDLGGGTFDVAVVGRHQGEFTVLAEAGLADLGGLDFDQVVLDLIGRSASAADPARWQAIARPTDGGTRRAARSLAEDVRAAKETLSDYAQTEVALPDPFLDVHLTRAELEGLIRPNLARSVEVLDQTLRNAGVAPDRLTGIFLVGGSSRVPLVARMIQERFHITPVALDQPETAVALGALALPRVRSDLRTAAGGPSSGGLSMGGPASAGPVSPPVHSGSAPAGPVSQPVTLIRRPLAGPPVTPAPRPSAGPLPPSGYQRPDWAAPAPVPPAPRSSRRALIVGAAATVVLAVALVLIIAKPFGGTSTAGPTEVSTPGGSRPGTPDTTGPSTTPSNTTTLSTAERAALGAEFDLGDCQSAPTTGSGSPVTIDREVACELRTTLTGGSVAGFVITLSSPADVTSYLDWLQSTRGNASGDEDRSWSGGRVITADKLPIGTESYPAVIWSRSGQPYVMVIAATGTVITRDNLSTLWQTEVGE